MGPWELAGLSRTKPLLLIPSGGLYGLGESEFFKAGLAEYARSGGIVICFTQKNGSDFAALPAPEGRKIEASGWAEDSGPLFRASTVQAFHPILSGMKTPTPAVETDGYLISLPKGFDAVIFPAGRFSHAYPLSLRQRLGGGHRPVFRFFLWAGLGRC